MTNHTPNRPHLDMVKLIPFHQFMTMPAEHLALLQEDAREQYEAAKLLKDWLDGVITSRYAERAHALRQELSKDCGSVRFEDGQVSIHADLPKKVDWNQLHLKEIVKKIETSGENPADYIETTLKVSERKYSAWPEPIRALFQPARTVMTGKQTFRLSINNKDLS